MQDTWKPSKQSPLHHALTRAGGVMNETSGWLLAEHFGDARTEEQAVRSGVGVLDRSAAPKFEVKGQDVSEFLSSVIGGAAPEPGHAGWIESGYGCRLSPQHALFILRDAGSQELSWMIAGQPADRCVHVIDRTNGYGGLLVCGPAAPDVLRKLTSLDLRETKFPHLSCAAGPLASVRAIVVRDDRPGLPAYDIFFSREYAEYLWNAMIDAGAEFGVRPFGLAAERLLEAGG